MIFGDAERCMRTQPQNKVEVYKHLLPDVHVVHSAADVAHVRAAFPTVALGIFEANGTAAAEARAISQKKREREGGTIPLLIFERGTIWQNLVVKLANIC